TFGRTFSDPVKSGGDRSSPERTGVPAAPSRPADSPRYRNPAVDPGSPGSPAIPFRGDAPHADPPRSGKRNRERGLMVTFTSYRGKAARTRSRTSRFRAE